jgi:hypothetical protein
LYLPPALFRVGSPRRHSNTNQDTQAASHSDLESDTHVGNATVTTSNTDSDRDAYSGGHTHTFVDHSTADADHTACPGHPDSSSAHPYATFPYGDVHHLLSVLVVLTG